MARTMTNQDSRLKTLPGRLQIVANSCGSLTELSKKSGVGISSLSRYLKGSEPSLSAAVAICSATDHSLEWLATGGGTRSVTSSEYINIPYHDVEVSAGFGAFPSGEERSTGTIALPKALLKMNHLGNRVLSAIQVCGDSMEPTLIDGSIIVIDQSNTKIIDGIYVLRRESTLLVKRLQLLENGIIRLISDNKKYEPEELPLSKHAESLSILGRVVWSGHNC